MGGLSKNERFSQISQNSKILPPSTRVLPKVVKLRETRGRGSLGNRAKHEVEVVYGQAWVSSALN